MTRSALRRFSCVLAGFLAAIGVWAGGLVPSVAVSVPAVATCPIPAYDSPASGEQSSYAASERGPPSSYDHNATLYDAVDGWSRGASARLDGAAGLATCDYYRSTSPAQVDRVEPATHEHAGGDDGELRAFLRTGVAAKTAANPCKVNSFTGVTLVLMADGSKKAIKDVELGDKVMAADSESGEAGARKVVDLIRHGGLHTMVAVRLADGTLIDATDRHPFWVESRGEWVDAIDLKPGDVVLSADGDRLAVASVRVSERDLSAYNLTVAGLHTYHVLASEVLVHNCSITNPKSFVNASRADAETALAQSGWVQAGATSGGGGVRWRIPGNFSDQVRIMPGKPWDPNPIKQGPYIRFSVGGKKHGPFSLRDY